MSQFTLETFEKLNSLPLQVVKVQLPEWDTEPNQGTFAYIGQMSSDERDERIEAMWVARKKRREQTNQVGFRAFAVAASVCDQHRNWLAPKAEDIDALADKFGKASGVPVSRMFDHVCTLNKLLAEDIKELEKN